MKKIKLSKENITEWKAEFNRIFSERTGFVGIYSETCDDEHWLDCYEDEEPYNAVSDEISEMAD